MGLGILNMSLSLIHTVPITISASYPNPRVLHNLSRFRLILDFCRWLPYFLSLSVSQYHPLVVRCNLPGFFLLRIWSAGILSLHRFIYSSRHEAKRVHVPHELHSIFLKAKLCKQLLIFLKATTDLSIASPEEDCFKLSWSWKKRPVWVASLNKK